MSDSKDNATSTTASSTASAAPAPDAAAIAAAEKMRDRQHRRCNSIIDKSIKNDFYVSWLMETLNNSGCKISRSFFQCAPCDSAGYFDKKNGKITLCQNQFDNFNDMAVTRIIRHELTHAYDICRAHVNTDNCLHVACTEIRASMLSGECSMSQELLRMQLPVSFSRHFRSCVRRRALLSLDAHPQCKPIAEKALDAAWNRCYNDTEPFDHRP